MPISFPSNPALNQVYVFGGRAWTYNGKGWFPASATAGNLLAVGSSVVPTANVTYDLGAAAARWKDLYLSGNTIDLGGTAIKSTANGVSFTSAANAQTAIPLTVSSIQLTSAGNVITLQAGASGLQVADTSGNVAPVGGGGATVTVSNSTPTSTTVGGLWLNDESGKLRIYYGGAWAGVASGPIGATGATGTAGTPGTAGTAGTPGSAGATGATGITPSLQTETFTVLTASTGVVAHNYQTGGLWTHTGISANFTANFTNVPTTDNRTHNFSLILYQGATAYYPNAVQIDGSAQTILWVDGNTPTPTANKTELATFALVRVSGAWRVLGSYSTFG